VDLVIVTVAFGGLKEADDAAGLSFPIGAEGIIAHLDDPEFAIGSHSKATGLSIKGSRRRARL